MLTSFKDWLPTLGIFATAAGGIITYAWQEHVKRRTALADRRQDLYEHLIRNLVELLNVKTAEESSKLITEIERGWLFASDRVLDASYDYLKYYDKICCSAELSNDPIYENVLAKVKADKEVRNKFCRCLAEIFLSMRQDIRPDTKLTLDWARQHFQIYIWGIIAKN